MALGTLLSLLLSESMAQPRQTIRDKGPRPLIDLAKVPATAYEKGKLELKLISAYKYLIQRFLRPDADGGDAVWARLRALDQRFGGAKAKLLFQKPLQDMEKRKLHEAWGFDLWLELTLDEHTDIKEAVRAYQGTGIFEVVEPVYVAEPIGMAAPPPADTPFVPNDPLLTQQWNLNNTGQAGGTPGKDISMFKAWGIETGKPQVIVSVHDNAINLSHPDLAQNIAVGKSYNFIDGTDSLTLNSNHGSHCGGIIGMVNNNGYNHCGIAGGDGSPSSGIRLMSCENFGPKGKAGGFAESLVYAADNGSVVSNNSWGYTEDGVYDIAVLDAIDYYAANGGGSVLKGGLAVFAAGNNGKNMRIFPGAYERSTCVAATNNKDIRSGYSNFGTWVDISAPGGEGFSGGGIFSTDNFNYSNGSGTSYACPHVVGVGALVASILQGKASGNDVNDILLSTVDDHYALNPNYAGLLGTGRLNAYSAVKKARSLLSLPSNAVTDFKASVECDKIKVRWTSSDPNATFLLAVSSGTNIVPPTEGKTYQQGDTLKDGSKIVYIGKGNGLDYAVIDSVLPYHFKIWTVVNGNSYSLSRNTEVWTRPTYTGIGDSVLKENFNSPPSFPNQYWRNSNRNLDYNNWVHTANDTAHTGAGDDYSVCLYNYQYADSLGIADTLFSPLVRTSGASKLGVRFWRAYQFLDKKLPYSDTLEVMVSTDCGQSFQSLWKKGGKQLATVNDTVNKAFYPFAPNSWALDSIDLSPFREYEKIMVGFRAKNGRGNNLFLDNISFYVKQDGDMALTAFDPNPDCNGQYAPLAEVANYGPSPVGNVIVNYRLDNGLVQSATVRFQILPRSSVKISLPASATSTGIQTFRGYLTGVSPLLNYRSANDSLTSVVSKTGIMATVPFHEGFEGNNFPPLGWTAPEHAADYYDWQPAQVASEGNKSALARSYKNPGDTNVSEVTTRPIYINTKSSDSLFLFFDRSSAQKADTPIQKNRLEVFVERKCGIGWQSVYKKQGTDLPTAPAQRQEFVPTKQAWKRDSVYIGNVAKSKDTIRLLFSFANGGTNNLYIDNIDLVAKGNPLNIRSDASSLPDPMLLKTFGVYPNPFQDAIQLVGFKPSRPVKGYALYNAVGKQVHNKTYSFQPLHDRIATGALPRGCYYLVLMYADKNEIIKLEK